MRSAFTGTQYGHDCQNYVRHGLCDICKAKLLRRSAKRALLRSNRLMYAASVRVKEKLRGS